MDVVNLALTSLCRNGLCTLLAFSLCFCPSTETLCSVLSISYNQLSYFSLPIFISLSVIIVKVSFPLWAIITTSRFALHSTSDGHLFTTAVPVSVSLLSSPQRHFPDTSLGCTDNLGDHVLVFGQVVSDVYKRRDTDQLRRLLSYMKILLCSILYLGGMSFVCPHKKESSSHGKSQGTNKTGLEGL